MIFLAMAGSEFRAKYPLFFRAVRRRQMNDLRQEFYDSVLDPFRIVRTDGGTDDMRARIGKGLFVFQGWLRAELIEHFEHGRYFHRAVLLDTVLIVIKNACWLADLSEGFFVHGGR